MDKPALDRLAALPRIPIAYLPTPIARLPNLSRHLGGPELFVKRDDQTGLATGGNKTRKLEFLIAQALEAGADSAITAGAAQSNHARQTAAAARLAGLEPHLVLRAPNGAPPSEITGNLLLDHLLGATIHWTEESAPYEETIHRVASALRSAGKNPFVIPYGGSNAVGLMGYAQAMVELADQAAEDPFDVHLFATSSGGTQAGMVLGAHLVGLPDSTRLLGISVDLPAPALEKRVAALIQDGARLLSLDPGVVKREIEIDDHYIGEGYAVVNEADREAVRLVARQEGILLDPVYTGRAFAGLLDLIQQRVFSQGERILFWHTGGSASLFAFADELLADRPS
jgi:L-cysteate sulfo-lyase